MEKKPTGMKTKLRNGKTNPAYVKWWRENTDKGKASVIKQRLYNQTPEGKAKARLHNKAYRLNAKGMEKRRLNVGRKKVKNIRQYVHDVMMAIRSVRDLY